MVLKSELLIELAVVLPDEEEVADEVEELILEERSGLEAFAVGKVDVVDLGDVDERDEVCQTFGDEDDHAAQFVHECGVAVDFAPEQQVVDFYDLGLGLDVQLHYPLRFPVLQWTELLAETLQPVYCAFDDLGFDDGCDEGEDGSIAVVGDVVGDLFDHAVDVLNVRIGGLLRGGRRAASGLLHNCGLAKLVEQRERVLPLLLFQGNQD